MFESHIQKRSQSALNRMLLFLSPHCSQHRPLPFRMTSDTEKGSERQVFDLSTLCGLLVSRCC